jgi:hypothetical protein
MSEDFQSITDWFIDVMAEFGQAEPTAMVVVFIDEQKDLIVRTTTGRAHAIGMLESAKITLADAYRYAPEKDK